MATYRFGERVDIDTIGPLPKNDYDNEDVVVIVEAFSRFVKLTPVKSTSRLDAARALIDLVGTFVCPRIIHSRNSVSSKPCHGGLRDILTRHDGRLEGGERDRRTRK
jgi:hypothetical protein